MIAACRTCRRVNPPDAAYCYFDGVPLEGHARRPAAPPGSEPFPMPFTFASGRACHNFNELALACHTDRAAGLEVLRGGHLERFLGGVGRLDLVRAAEEAARFPDRERGLDQLLGQLPGDVLTPGQMVVKTPGISLGTLVPGTDRRFVLTLQNGGMRLLYGSVTVEEAPWLAFADSVTPNEKLFQFDGRIDVTVQVVGKQLRAGKLPLEGRLIVSSNGGSVSVLVRAEVPVRPFPDGVLKGATTPRQVAEKARALPKDAAVFFENGAVPQWYNSNGWVYPVQGPSASGLGAVQQFFEALGLTRPPKVVLNVPSLNLHGRPGDPVSHILRAQTEENRPVFAHAVSDRSWLIVGRIELKGRVALIPLSVRAIPDAPGQTLSAKVTVQANGNQRFVVPVTLTVRGTKSAGRGRTAPEEFVPVVLPADERPAAKVLPINEEFTPVVLPADRSAPVEVLPLDDAIEVSPADPPRRRSKLLPEAVAVPPRTTAQARGGRWLHLAPLGVFALIFLGLFVRDLFVSAEDDLDDDNPQAVVVIDPNPQIAVRFHDAPKDLNDLGLLQGTMRFGLVMLTENEGGNPKKLTFDLYGRTNNTCLRVDGKDALFGDTLGARWIDRGVARWKDETGQEHDGMKSVWSLSRPPVSVAQTVEVVPGEVTQDANGRLVRYRDTCLVRYLTENTDGIAHTVGLRFLLDTYIGANDGVPFVIPGEAGLCDTMKEFSGIRAVPSYIQAQEHDDQARPGTVAHLQFKLGDPIEAPDRVTLGAWPDASLSLWLGKRQALGPKTLWDVPVLPIRALADEARRRSRREVPPDSAVVMYWEPRRLGPGERRGVGFAYGLGKVSASKGNFLLTGDGAAVEGQEFTVQAVVSRPTPGQTLTLTLPSGLKLGEGVAAEQKVSPVAPNSTRESSTVTWQVRAVREGVYRLEVKSDTGASQKHPVRVRAAMSPFGRN
ncbi:MAG TPA: hypothetical protein VKA46_29225 [Gemmataceae bacterium]|nr:hypothetical protein [Gemmataceae bacterium]